MWRASAKAGSLGSAAELAESAASVTKLPVARCGLRVAPRKFDNSSRSKQQAGTKAAGLPLTISTVERRTLKSGLTR